MKTTVPERCIATADSHDFIASASMYHRICKYCDVVVTTDYANNYPNNVKESTIPPTVKPRLLHDKDRIKELGDAIARYVLFYNELPVEWILEYNELAKLLKGREMP